MNGESGSGYGSEGADTTPQPVNANPEGATSPDQVPAAETTADDITTSDQGPATDSTDGDGGGRRWGLWVAIAAGVILLLVVLGVLLGSVTTPSVVGLPRAQAASELEAAGLTVGRVSEEATLAVKPGTVTNQSPAADSRTRKGTAVDLVVATAVTATVPDVVGMSESEAEAELAAAGLRVGAVTGAYSADVKPGVVLTQSPESGAGATVGSQVELEVSLGPETAGVPNVVGLTAHDAEAVLTAAGFSMKETSATSTEVKPGTVIRQAPTPGTIAEKDSAVTVTVSSGPPAATTPPPTTPEQPQPPTGGQTAPQPEPKPEPEPEQVDLPDVVGMRALEAIRALRDASLEPEISWGPTSENFLQVIKQDPSAGTSVSPGSRVEITIGLPEFLFGTIERPEVNPPDVGTPEATTLPAPSDGATEGTTSP